MLYWLRGVRQGIIQPHVSFGAVVDPSLASEPDGHHKEAATGDRRKDDRQYTGGASLGFCQPSGTVYGDSSRTWSEEKENKTKPTKKHVTERTKNTMGECLIQIRTHQGTR